MRICADALQHVAQVLKRINVQAFACGCDARQDRSDPPSFVATIKIPVFSSHRDPTKAAFGAVVVDFQVAVMAITHKCIPV